MGKGGASVETEHPFRARLRMQIGSRVRWISHLEYLRMMTRTLRRSKLPIMYSEGFNPHVRIAFAHARPVGLSSDGEYADVMLFEQIPIDEVKARLDEVLPAGFVVLEAHYVAPSGPGLSSVLNAGRYQFEFVADPEDISPWTEGLERLQRETELPVIRHRHRKPPRSLNLAPHVYNVQVEASESTDLRSIVAELATGSQFNIRPHEFLEVLIPFLPKTGEREAPTCLRVHRLDLFALIDGQRRTAWDL